MKRLPFPPAKPSFAALSLLLTFSFTVSFAALSPEPARAQTPLARPVSPVAAPAVAPQPVALPVRAVGTGGQVGQILGSQPALLQRQVAALQSLNASLQALVAAMNVKLSQDNVKLSQAQAPPIPLGQPYTNTTGQLVFAHFQSTCIAAGTSNGIAGSVAGYTAAINEAVAAGYDGFAIDLSAPGGNFDISLANLFLAADQRNLAAGWGPGQTGTPTAKGVTKFRLYLVFDCATFPEVPATLSAEFLAHCHDDAYWTVGGNPATGVSARPVMSTYTGSDNATYAAVKAIWQPTLALIQAAGVNPYFLPGFNTTPDGPGNPQPSEAAWVQGQMLGLADGAWQFPSTNAPLNDDSSSAGMEGKAAAVKAAGLGWQAPVIGQFCTNSHPENHYYLEYEGGEGTQAAWLSALSQNPTLGYQLQTFNDAGEGTNRSSIYNSQMNPALAAWVGFPNSGILGFYHPKDGMRADEDYFIQRAKTGQWPAITSDRVCAYYRTETAAASQTASTTPLVYSHSPDGAGRGMTFAPDVVWVTCYLASSAVIRLTQDNGVVQQYNAPPGKSFLRIPFVAGSVKIDALRNNAAFLTMTGAPIASASPGGVGNPGYYTMTAHN